MADTATPEPAPTGAVRRTPNSNHGVAGRVLAVVQRDYERARIELRKLNDAMLRKNRVLAKRTAERDALQGRIDAALALTEPHPLRHWDTQWPIRAALEGMTAGEYAGEAGTDVAPPLTAAQRAEVDELARRMLADDLANLAESPEADRG